MHRQDRLPFFLNQQGYVCELTGDNLFIVKNKRVITPPLWCGILDGITRRAILRVADEQGFETAENPLTLHDVYTSDECFCTATRIEVLPIVWVDGRKIGDGKPGAITLKLTQEFIVDAPVPVFRSGRAPCGCRFESLSRHRKS